MPPFQAQFSLSLELAKLASLQPVRAAVSYTADAIYKLALDLKKTGSDFLVEHQLANIFGRMRTESSLETHFREAVKVNSFVPLYPQSDIALAAGPGPTVIRGLQDQRYMSMIIQLSFLAWNYERNALSVALVQCMSKRFELGVNDSTPTGDVHGVAEVLRVCSSQTSQFSWMSYTQSVVNRCQLTSLYEHQMEPYKELPPHILLGLMDYLYAVQTLPEDRCIVIYGDRGLIPIVIWAHYILGLVVSIVRSSKKSVCFGKDSPPHVTVNWTLEGDGSSLNPRICLLDKEANVVLQLDASNHDIPITAIEKGPLKGYATESLRRMFNKEQIMSDENAVSKEFAEFATAYAVFVSRAFYRLPFGWPRPGAEAGRIPEIPPQCYERLELWRILDSSVLIFDGIDIDKTNVQGHTDRLHANPPIDRRNPSKLATFFSGIRDSSSNTVLWTYLHAFASLILTVAHVVDISTCANLPVIYPTGGHRSFTWLQSWDYQSPIDIDANIWFEQLFILLKGELSSIEKEQIREASLISENGWSFFVGSIGDNDPGQISPELLFLKRGVPTNTKTGERKYSIVDLPIWANPTFTRPLIPTCIDSGPSYIPRCIFKQINRADYYSTGAQEFGQRVCLDFRACGLFPDGTEEHHIYKYTSYRRLHDFLWRVVRTTPCEHSASCKDFNQPVALDPGVVTVAGIDIRQWRFGEATMLISLAFGSSHARSSVIADLTDRMDPNDTGSPSFSMGARKVMLRQDDCCPDCAVRMASRWGGKWLIIL